MDLWCPFAIRDQLPGLPGAGPMVGGGAPKWLHHTTDGGTYGGARSTYLATHDYPTFTDSWERGAYQVWQHLPLDVAATALKHQGGETNRDNVRQVEHVCCTDQGLAARLGALWVGALPAGYLQGIARLSRWVEAATGAARAAPYSFGPDAPRLDWPTWHATSGHLGHCHAPENDHRDPIGLAIAAVLQPTPLPPTGLVGVLDLPGEDTMNRQRRTYDCGTLDEHGSGSVLFDGGANGDPRIAHFEAIPWHLVASWPVAQGSYPPVDGNRGLPVAGPQDRDGYLCVEFSGGPPHGPVTLLVDVLVP